MRILKILVGAATVGVTLLPAAGQEPTATAVPKGEPPTNRAEVIKQFDKNGDGILDEAERQAARQAMSARNPRRPGGTSDAAPEVTRRFDTNGDGKIDDAERQAARDALAKNRPAAVRIGTNGPARAQVDRQAVVREFDKDGDGKLNDDERKAAMQAMRERMQRSPEQGAQARPVRAELIKRFDSNGDGVLDDAERQAARESVAKKESPDTKPVNVPAPAESPASKAAPAAKQD